MTPEQIEEGRRLLEGGHTLAEILGWLHNNAAALLSAASRVGALEAERDRLREALSELLAICIEEFGSPDDSDDPNESVGWKGDGSPVPMTYGHMQRARAALKETSHEG